jgi:hypothetical protein
MKSKRVSIGPGTGIAVLALFFALGGSAFAVGERVQGSTAAEQQRCGQGDIRGIARITGGAAGPANIPGNFSGRPALFAQRFNCSRGATQVRRIQAGIFEVRFTRNLSGSAVVSGASGAYASVDPLGGGVFRVVVYPPGIRDPADLPFTIVAV